MKCAIAIDIGGTQIKYALIGPQGEIHHQALQSSRVGGQTAEFIERLINLIREVLELADDLQLEVIGIGVGVPSVVEDGVVLFSNNLPELNKQPLGEILRHQFNLPVLVENDANLMGLGETRYGAARGVSDAVLLTIGTGVGGALIVNGKLYAGYRHRGAELGHILVDCHGRPCSCGARGCLEAVASVNALVQDYQQLIAAEGRGVKIDGQYIVDKYRLGEVAAVTAFNQHFDYLAAGITGFINVFAPQKVIIGGGISEAGEFYVQNLRERVGALVMKETSSLTSIELAVLGNRAGFLGAAALVFADQTRK